MSQATTSFDLYLCAPSLSSTGFPPEGGCTYDLLKDLLQSELEGHVIFEVDLNIKYSASLFHQLVPKFSLKITHITRIKYYGRNNGPPVYFQGAWNFNRQKKPKLNDQSNNSSSGNSDADKSGTSTDFDIDDEALDSQGSGMISQDTDGTWSHDEYDGTAEPGSKRRCKPSSTEKDLQCLFKAVMYALRCEPCIRAKLPFQSSNIECYWSAEFANSPIQDSYNAQKPDVALFYYKSKTCEKTWTDVLSFIEHTSSDFSKRHDLGGYWGSTTKAYLIMREQPWCRFITSFSICANQLRAHYYDRSGLIITLPTPIQSSPTRVADAIAALSLADPSLLGLDPTIHMCIPSCKSTHTDLAVGAIGWVTNNADKRYSIMAVLWKSQGLFCRGTVCYRVQDPVDGKEYAMKDCWVNEVKRYHEVDVLKRLKGIPNVVQLIDHWDVLFNGEPDCTSRIRDGYGVLEDWPDKSPNNFVIHEGIGYFIDFDHTSIIKEGETFTVSFGTGTVPYISMRILKKMSKNADIIKKSIKEKKNNSNNSNSIAQLELVEHNPSDDLESLFYIFFEFVSKYRGAHGTLAPTWDKTSMPWADAYKNLGATSGLLATFLAKKGAMSEGDILMDRSPNLEGAIIHNHIFQMLVKFITKLNDEEPNPFPSPYLPVAPPSAPSTHRTGAPPVVQPTAGPSLCRSLWLSTSWWT
ncbi:uncharacterized protein F5147DRAFT_775242 [Suillus discolor]|uniref:Fungal-type protein kinase domain-containing protein n=1 Tax=Suillus discolor TaxID=1912936 RepID=A0A9P7F3Q2_9AGAM|nr:uncharacterized protein F5147DRAFT_775242 [Suillus discolor]KAG2105473.1 hypothetical protein F5147DRAFT_775242 [Suillus discolor]